MKLLKPNIKEPLYKDAKVDRKTWYRAENGLSKSDIGTLDKIAKRLNTTFRKLTGEEPGESEARVMQLISDNIKRYLKDHPNVDQTTFGNKAGITQGQVSKIINKQLRTIPDKPTLVGIAKAIGGENATIDDTLLKPLPPAS
jgi:transcriptional regulator with XRE-family HTH domain